MRSNDLTLSRSEIRERLMQALADNDKEKYDQAFGEMIQCVAQDVEAKNKVYLEEAQQAADRQTLAERGVRQLTSAERKYYQALSTAMKAEDPKQALTNTDLVLPTTVLDAVFDELQTSHPLLSRISFTNTSGVVEMLMSENGIQQAVWGKLCGPIVQELLANFVSVKTTLLKLSAFIPVADCIVSDVQPGTGTVQISVRPLQALFDVEVFASPITDVAAWLTQQITEQFVSNADTLQNRPVTVASTVRTAYPLTEGDSETLVLTDIMAQALTTYGIFVDCYLDMKNKRVAVQIVPPGVSITLESGLPNVLDKEMTLGDSYGSTNKIVIRKQVTDEETGAVTYPDQVIYYLHPDGTVDTTDSNRITPVFWTLANLADSDTWDQDAQDKAVETLTPEQYDNEIILQYRAGDNLVRPEDIQIGTTATIMVDGTAYTSILTGRSIDAGTVTITFGAVRVDLTKQLLLQRRKK